MTNTRRERRWTRKNDGVCVCRAKMRRGQQQDEDLRATESPVYLCVSVCVYMKKRCDRLFLLSLFMANIVFCAVAINLEARQTWISLKAKCIGERLEKQYCGRKSLPVFMENACVIRRNRPWWKRWWKRNRSCSVIISLPNEQHPAIFLFCVFSLFHFRKQQFPRTEPKKIEKTVLRPPDQKIWSRVSCPVFLFQNRRRASEEEVKKLCVFSFILIARANDGRPGKAVSFSFGKT